MTPLAFPKCQMKGGPCFSFGPDLVTPLHAIGWAFVASLLVYVVFKVLRRTDHWSAMGLGCGFWVLGWIAVGSAGISGGAGGAVLAIVAFWLAAAIIGGRPRSSAHGEVTGDPP